jgi:hypothetical protein
MKSKNELSHCGSYRILTTHDGNLLLMREDEEMGFIGGFSALKDLQSAVDWAVEKMEEKSKQKTESRE